MQLITICSYIIQEGNGINTEDSRRKGSSKVTPMSLSGINRNTQWNGINIVDGWPRCHY